MARQNTKNAVKTPGEETAVPAAVPAPMDETETGPEALETAAPAAGAMPPKDVEEAVVRQETPGEKAEAGAVPGEDALLVAQAAPAEQSAPMDRAETGPEGRRAVVRSPKGLNLRAGPALSYDALEVLPDGVTVTVLELPGGVTVPGWELVCTGPAGAPTGVQHGVGWCSARFLRPLEG